MDIFPASNGRERMVVSGVEILARLLLKVGIFPASNGREKTTARVMAVLVVLLLKVGISPASYGREKMDVHGTKPYTIKLKNAATQMCSSMLLIKGARQNSKESPETLSMGLKANTKLEFLKIKHGRLRLQYFF